MSHSLIACFSPLHADQPAPSPDHCRLIVEIEKLARASGQILLSYYDRPYDIAIKDDNSPVTIADEDSSRFLVSGISSLTPAIPVISEENEIDGNGLYWAIDPLDGTKEFIGKTGGFCNKIALIDHDRPVLGMVFCPAQNVLYACLENGWPVKIVKDGPPQRLQTRPAGPRLTTLFNKRHSDPAEYKTQRIRLAKEWGLNLSANPRVKPGLPRNLQIAEGLADIHLASGYGDGPLKGSGFVWDVAPDHLILNNAGGFMVNLDGTPLRYDSPRKRMPAYIACGDPGLRPHTP